MRLTNGDLSQRLFAPTAAPGAGQSIGGAASASQMTGQTGARVTDVQGTGPLTGSHNTPLQVASLVLFAGLGLAAMRWAGFRFSFDSGFGK